MEPTVVEPSLKDGERLVETTLKAERGHILGADDQPIVTPRPVLHVGLDKTGLPRPRPPTPRTDSPALLDIDAKAFVKQVNAHRAQGVRRRASSTASRTPRPRCWTRLSGIKGAGAVAGTLPLAPTKDFAAAILGTVGPATAELVKDSKGRIKPGDEVGLSGLQKRYDEQLAGTRGATVVGASTSKGQRRDPLHRRRRSPAPPLHTTLDLAGAERRPATPSPDVGPASALVAIRPSTGDLVAVASGPGSKGYNTATYGRYAPGSTFKVVSALALLRAGVTPQTRVDCPPTTVVDGKTFKNYDDYPSSGFGAISFEDALANSCNTAFIGQRGKLGQTSLAEAAAALGFGVDHDTGFPTFFGEVGTPGSETQAAASMIGQGTVLASPMAMATVVASVLKGSAVLPRLLPDVKVQAEQPAKPLTAKEAGQLRTMMRAVVERGSGAALQDLPGGPVIAKTGTAEFGDKPPLPTHAWMVAGRDDLAVAVFVERGESGSGTAGPDARAVPARRSDDRVDARGGGPHLPPGRPGQPAAAPASYGAGAGRRRRRPDAAVLRLRPGPARACAGGSPRAAASSPASPTSRRRCASSREETGLAVDRRRPGRSARPSARGARLHRRGRGAGRGVPRA